MSEKGLIDKFEKNKKMKVKLARKNEKVIKSQDN